MNVSYFQMHYWNVVHNYSEVIKCMAYKYMITTLNDLYVTIVQHFRLEENMYIMLYTR